ncbi:MAG: hypothetical protein LBO65_09230 [Spirochaetaceae bacterium]|nr:hypothetical protein [Spirochaetaceae bacterium]
MTLVFPALILPGFGFSQSGRQPRWVNDPQAVYPDRDWLCFVETGGDRPSAEAAAMNALAQSIRVDVKSVTDMNQTLVRRVTSRGNNSLSESAEYKKFAQDVAASSTVSGLIGVEKEFWSGRNGDTYALVRMNRAGCSDRYRTLIAENERLIEALTERAGAMPGTFDAYENLAFAEQVAEITDSYIMILSVLQSEGALQKPRYGNAGMVKMLLQNAARLVVVNIRIAGDTDNRLSKAFAAAFSTRGFRTTARAGEAAYIFQASYRAEPSPQQDPDFKYVNYVVTAALLNKQNEELMSWSLSDREGHMDYARAYQQALRATEKAINEKEFAAALDAYLASLL